MLFIPIESHKNVNKASTPVMMNILTSSKRRDLFADLKSRSNANDTRLVENSKRKANKTFVNSQNERALSQYTKHVTVTLFASHASFDEIYHVN